MTEFQYFNEENSIRKKRSNSQRINHAKKTKYEDNKCEGCFKMEAMKSCILCGKIFCKMCDFQVHMLKANSHHNRSRIHETEHIINKCIDHDLKLLFFCETCNKAICDMCHKEGKHCSKLHSISHITESFQFKFERLNSFLSKELMTKYVILHEQIKHVERLCEKVRENSMKIEKQIKEEHLRLITRLKDDEGKKLACLDHEARLLEKEIQNINEVVNFVKEMDGSSPDVLHFHEKYKTFNEKAEKSFAFEIKKNYDVDPDDFVNVIEENRRKVDKIESLEKILKAKDDIIWGLILEKNKSELNDDYQKDYYQKYKNEVHECKLTIRNLKEEVNKFKLNCYFCKEPNDEKHINSDCSKVEELSLNNKIRRHFFVRPNLNSFSPEINKGIFKDNSQNTLKDKKIGRKSVSLSNSFSKTNRFPEKVTLNQSINLSKNHHVGLTGIETISQILNKINEKGKSLGTNAYQILIETFNKIEVLDIEKIIKTLREKFELKDDELMTFIDFLYSNMSYFSYEKKKLSLSKFLSLFKYYSTEIESIKKYEGKNKILDKIKEKNINLDSILTNYDFSKKGLISLEDLKLVLNKLDIISTSKDFKDICNNFKLEKTVKIKEFVERFTKEEIV